MDLVQLLLEASADKDCADDRRGTTALMVASRAGHVDTVRVLLDAGANLGGNYNGHTALILASTQGHLETARMLLQAGGLEWFQVRY